MKTNEHRPRNTRAKAIKTAAQSENAPYKAHEIAFWGRPQTALEEELNLYYASKAGLKTGNDKKYQGGYEVSKGELTTRFFVAIDNYDSQKIQEIAEAVRFFRGVKRPEPEPADRERSALLELKILFPRHAMMLPKVAKHLVRRGIMTRNEYDAAAAGGFSALRRMCKALNIPLADSRKISPN